MSQATQEVMAAPVSVMPEELETHSIVGDLVMLTKARLTMLVLVTTFVGFCMGSGERLDWFLLLKTLLGTALVAASAAVLNQVIEARVDRLMERTRDRPLPAGRMKSSTALTLGVVMAATGLLLLFTAVSAISGLLAAMTLLIYLFVYTPMKRRSPLCVAIGAVSGAIPPVIGWTAASGSFGTGAWILFGVLFLWQMPHFRSIAWMYRDEYAQAGFFMLHHNDIGGNRVARESFLYTLLLAVVVMLPATLHLATSVYLAGATVCSALFVLCAIQFLMQRNRLTARRLFFASIIYLPCVLGLMVFTRA